MGCGERECRGGGGDLKTKNEQLVQLLQHPSMRKRITNFLTTTEIIFGNFENFGEKRKKRRRGGRGGRGEGRRVGRREAGMQDHSRKSLCEGCERRRQLTQDARYQ